MIQCLATGLVYRNPKPHLRSVHAWHPSLARIEGEKWINLAEAALWTGAAGGSGGGMDGTGSSSNQLSNLKFGFPSMVELPTGEIFAVFWCFEDGLHNIRWVKVRID